MLKSPITNALADVLIERTSSIFDEIASKTLVRKWIVINQ